jgi:hypothetical protein
MLDYYYGGFVQKQNNFFARSRTYYGDFAETSAAASTTAPTTIL